MIFLLLPRLDAAANSLSKLKDKAASFDDVVAACLGGDLNFLPSYNDITTFVRDVTYLYPEVATMSSIGKTFQDREIPLLTLSLQPAESSYSPSHIESSILIDGLQHARELVTLSMFKYLVLRLLYDYEHDDQVVRILLENHRIYLVPAVNVDTLLEISNYYYANH